MNVGRSHGVAPPLRHCDMCATRAVGDEHQLNFKCPALEPALERLCPFVALAKVV